MSAFRTCKNCVREKEPCERRDALKASLLGLGVLSLKHRCVDRRPLFQPGQRVLTTWTVPAGEENGYDYTERNEEDWPATVIQEVGVKFLIKVDDVLSDHETMASEYFNNKSLFVKARAGKLKALDEPPQPLCKACQRPGSGALGEGGCYGHTAKSGWDGWGESRPHGCLATEKTAETLADDPARPDDHGSPDDQEYPF